MEIIKLCLKALWLFTVSSNQSKILQDLGKNSNVQITRIVDLHFLRDLRIGMREDDFKDERDPL